MKTWRVALVVVLAMGALIVGAACGGGDEEVEDAGTTATAEVPTAAATAERETATPVVTATPLARAQLEGLLKSMTLALEELPSGFTLDEEKFTTNEEAAEDDPEGEEKALADYSRWGRLLGYEASYLKAVSLTTLLGGTFAIQVGTDIYGSSEGAKQAFEWGRERLSDPQYVEWGLETLQDSASNLKLAPMSFAQVGDETAAFQVTGTYHAPEPDLEAEFVIQMVAIRRDRGIGWIFTVALMGPSPVDELEAMARKLDDRMEAALR